jgi:hypothetical protein
MSRAKLSDRLGGDVRDRVHARETAQASSEQVQLLRQLVWEQQQTNYLLGQLLARR